MNGSGLKLVLLLSTVTFVSTKGARVLATLFAIELGAGPFATGLLFAVYGLPPFLLVVYAGRIADRIGNRVLMYLGLAGTTVSLALPTASPTLVMLFVAAALLGGTSMLFVVATQNLVGLLAGAGGRTRSFSYYSQGESAASIAGPIVAGFAIDHFGHVSAYVILAAITASCCLVLLAGRRRIPEATAPRQEESTAVSGHLLRLPALRNALITNGVVMTGLDLYVVYFPIYARAIGLSASTIGLIIGAFGAAGFIVRTLIPVVTDRWGERAMIAVALALAAAAYVAVPLSTSPLLLGATSFLLGLGLGCGQPLSMILAFNAAPEGRSAEAIGMRLSVSYGAHVVIPPIFGALGALVGLAPVFWTCAVLLSGGAALNGRARTPA